MGQAGLSSPAGFGQALRPGGSGATVAIIGGGFTGATLAAQLLRRGPDSSSVVLIEPGDCPGRGVAYGTHYGWHLLNVVARDMSALEDDPDDFLRWARANYDSAVGPESFLPRRVYGQYISALLVGTVALNRGRFFFKHDEAISVKALGRGGVVDLRSGDSLVADKIVLATGNFPPRDPDLPGKTAHSTRYVPYAWSSAALADLAPEGEVLLLGSGLTAIDQVLALRAREFRGRIHLLSRHGLLPQPHQSTAPWPAFWNEASPQTARGLLRLVRQQVRSAHRSGKNWRGVIEAIRPFTQRMWQSLPAIEKRRFLRHLRPYWEIHRHRVAPEIHQLIAYQLRDGETRVHAGWILRYEEGAQGVAVTYRRRRTGDETQLLVDRVINCTGHETDCRKLDSPLLRQLRQEGLIRPDSLGLGVDVDENGALLNRDGAPSDFLYAIGPPRKGALWETTAVPEIRRQISDLVHRLKLSLNARLFSGHDLDHECAPALSE
ncbi:MAG TPA: FAD-dependent oxidoreductase [Terriglobales bacterium]|nr:FAD-dependent oxidoreductase [Terriglobales bacterium]